MVRRVKREIMANGKSVMGMDEGTVGDQEGGITLFWLSALRKHGAVREGFL